ncbi:MAG: winged helix-turn-helix transcriptional regulator [Candidatus Thorarchaeota archaeon]
MVTLDSIDKAILLYLDANCRISYRALARKTGLSPNAARNRIVRLIDEGVIIRFVIEYTLEMIDASHFMALVNTDGTENLQQFVLQIGEQPMVYHVNVLGNMRGGAYLVTGQSIGDHRLAEFGAYLRALNEVQSVELHTMLPTDLLQGRKVEFSRVQLKVLNCLCEDARMQITEIAEMTGMAPKTVRRAIKEIADSGGVIFTMRSNLAAGGFVDAFVRIHWNDKMISADELIKWLQDEYPTDFWYPWVSATESMLYADILAGSLLEVEQIANGIRSAPFVKSTATLIATSNVLFEKLTERRLREILDAEGV